MSGSDTGPAYAPPVEPGALVEALSRPEAYPRRPQSVAVVQTHISWVFLAGDRVYKVKRPVDLGFLDFSTQERRRHFCEEELRLNRRLAPDVYLGVVPVTLDAEGRPRIGGDGPLVDHAVEMVRLPAEGMLDLRLERGALDNRLLDELAGLLVRFHEQAPTGAGVDRYGRPGAVHELVLGNLAALEPFAGSAGGAFLSAPLVRFLQDRADAFLASHRRLFEQRVARGRIREGHGDLHAANICVTDQGLVVYDCIEFDAALRCCDVAADLAFLAMDLDHRGFFAFSRWLVGAYARAADDQALPWLMDFYKGYRAVVRAKVAALGVREAQRPAEERNEQRRKALGYLHLAAGYELPPVLVLLCGLPATGKSWLARELARPLAARVLRSDVERKRQAGLAPTSRLEGEAAEWLYAAARTDELYRSLCRRAVALLDQGRSVVVDATFATRAPRRRLVDVAVRLEHPVVLVRVSCPEDEVRRRLAARAERGNDPSDADQAVYERMRERFEPPDELHPPHRVDVSGVGEPEPAVAAMIDALLSQIGVGPPRAVPLP